jgi:hypothetical protein
MIQKVVWGNGQSVWRLVLVYLPSVSQDRDFLPLYYDTDMYY